MAKKKVSHPTHEPKPQPTHQEKAVTQSTMEDPQEKLQNLKSLNSMLLKETLERRHQVESLTRAKDGLESELVRVVVQKRELESGLNRASDEKVVLEMEKDLFWVFVETQMSEMVSERNREREGGIGLLKGELNGLMADLENERERLSQACRERDGMKSDLNVQAVESNGLRQKVKEMEKKQREFEEEIEKFQVQCKGLMEEKEERERAIKAVEREKYLVESNLMDTMKEIENLKMEMERILSEKREIEREKGGQEERAGELETKVGKLNEIVLSLRKEEVSLHTRILGLEESCGEAMVREEEMMREINALEGEIRELERSTEKLMEEKNSNLDALNVADLKIKDKNQEIVKLFREKNELKEEKISKENEIAELHKEVSELRDAVFALEESCREKEKKNKQLIIEGNQHRNACDRVMLERDAALTGLDEEKKNSMNLRAQIAEIEKRIAETVEELEAGRTEHKNLTEEKEEMKKQVELLVKEKDLVQKNLSEAQRVIEVLRAKMESVDIKHERVLALLKSTTALLCESSNGKEVVVTEQRTEDEIRPYATELEAIKKAFRKKETMVEDMKQKVEVMQNSVAEAHKKKSLWTLLSSATTILAAVSVAYAARLR